MDPPVSLPHRFDNGIRRTARLHAFGVCLPERPNAGHASAKDHVAPAFPQRCVKREVMSLAKTYADVCAKRPRSYWYYEGCRSPGGTRTATKSYVDRRGKYWKSSTASTLPTERALRRQDPQAGEKEEDKAGDQNFAEPLRVGQTLSPCSTSSGTRRAKHPA